MAEMDRGVDSGSEVTSDTVEKIVGIELQSLIADACAGSKTAQFILKKGFPQTYALFAFAYDWEENNEQSVP